MANFQNSENLIFKIKKNFQLNVNVEILKTHIFLIFYKLLGVLP